MFKRNLWNCLICLTLIASSCSLPVQTEDYFNFGWSPDGIKYFYDSNLDYQIHVVNLETRIESKFDPTRDRVTQVDWYDSDKIAFIYYGEEDNDEDSLMILDVNTLEIETLFTLPGFLEYCWLDNIGVFVVSILEPKILEDGMKSFRLSSPEKIRFFDLGPRTWLKHIYTRNYGEIKDLACEQTGNKIAFVDENDLVVLQISENFKISELFVVEGQNNDRFDNPTWNSDGSWLAAIRKKGGGSPPLMGISLISIEDGSQREIIAPRRSNRPTDIAWSPTENVLLTRFVGSGFSLELVDIPDELLK